MVTQTLLKKAGWLLLGLTLCLNSTLIAQATPPTEPTVQKARQLFHQFGMDFISGNSDIEEGTSLSLSIVNGYKFSDQFRLGVGVGWDNYSQMDILPLFLRAIGTLKPEGHSPFAFLDAGYSWAWEKGLPEFVDVSYTDGGWVLQSGLGYMFDGKNWNITLHAGFKVQQSTIAYTFNDVWIPQDDEVKEERTRKRFTVGISFLL